MLKYPKLSEYDLSFVHSIKSGAAPLKQETIDLVKVLIPSATIYQGSYKTMRKKKEIEKKNDFVNFAFRLFVTLLDVILSTLFVFISRRYNCVFMPQFLKGKRIHVLPPQLNASIS